MYLHLGGDISVNRKYIVGIFDLDNTSTSKITREYLNKATKENKVIPYMVIDDGWSIHPCSGPWDVNDKFMDMEKLAQEMKTHRVRPGIWFRPLKDSSGRYDDFMHPLRQGLILDPSTPECLNLIKQDITNFINWGYELIKLDFVTVDIFLNYGFEMDKNLTPQGWRYKDNHYTNAEIIKNYNSLHTLLKYNIINITLHFKYYLFVIFLFKLQN